MPLHVSSTCVHHQEVKIVLHSLWYHHTYKCDHTIGCFHIRTVQHLDIIKVLFIHQLMHW